MRDLSVGDNNLQDEGVAKLSKALMNHHNLWQLSLKNNNITEGAADDIAAVLSHILIFKFLFYMEIIYKQQVLLK